MIKEFGLRERKKAQLKIGLVDVLTDGLNEHHFDDIKVKDLCSQMSISEVTFFKYFEKKEVLLQYYMEMWNYRREIQIASSGRLKGLDGLYKIFEDIARTDNAIVILNTLTTYLVRLRERPTPIILSDCEKWLLDAEADLSNPLSLNKQFELHLKEASEMGQLNPSKNPLDYYMLLSSIFYGCAVIAHTTEASLEKHFVKSLNIIFNIGD